MSKVGRNTYVEYEYTEIIGKTSGTRETARARAENDKIDRDLATAKKEWVFVPASNFTLAINGLILSVPAEAGRMLLHKRGRAAIIEHEVAIDAVIDGEIEDVIEALGGLK